MHECTLPADRGGLRRAGVYTDHAVFLITADGVTVRETYGTTLAELRSRVGLPLDG